MSEISQIERELKVIKDLIFGNGNPEKGLIFRLSKIEGLVMKIESLTEAVNTLTRQQEQITELSATIKSNSRRIEAFEDAAKRNRYITIGASTATLIVIAVFGYFGNQYAKNILDLLEIVRGSLP